MKWWRAKSPKTPLLSLLCQPTCGLKAECMCAIALESGDLTFFFFSCRILALGSALLPVCGRCKMQHIYCSFQFLSTTLSSLKTGFTAAQVLPFSGILVLLVEVSWCSYTSWGDLVPSSHQPFRHLYCLGA